MHFSLITLFPEFFTGPLTSGLMQRATATGVVSFSFHNPRDTTTDNHRSVDDRPYGGGPGMVMLPAPLATTLESLGYSSKASALPCLGNAPSPGRLIYLSPKGQPLTQKLAEDLAKEPCLTLMCGRYEGIDSRIEELYPVELVSVGDFVLNGGETGALCLIESISRLLPGFMGHEESGTEESFSNGLLEYRHYTRPETFQGIAVPEVLRSGDHAVIHKFRQQERLQATLENRPDLLQEAILTPDDRHYLRTLHHCRPGRNLYCGLVHYPVLDKEKNSVAVSLTNLDVHDIGRSSCTYGLGGFYVLTPLKDQQALLQDIIRHWTDGAGGKANQDRKTALGSIKGLDHIVDAVNDILSKTGQKPFIVGTTAVIPTGKKKHWPTEISFAGTRNLLSSRPVLLIFGTGHGLAPEAHALCDAFLPPVRWHGTYNHLSVRSACAIILDRLLGDWF